MSSRLMLALCFFSWSLTAIAGPSSIAESPAWLNLLYYEKSGSSYESLVTKKTFFLTESGHQNPTAELNAAVESFQKDLPVSDSHPQCLFPARYQFLREHFELKPPVRCPQFQQWQDHYAPQKLILVYASQYISNPASVFGHSFLMIPSQEQTQGFWLTYNYAAAMPKGTSAFSYVYGGLTGWFQGDYTVMPFYNRIYQYGSIENRDLWLYEIKLSDQEFSFVMSHLWELVHASSFTYYFLNENCAGILLRTLAATVPELRDSSRLPIYVHPMEVIHRLNKVDRIAGADIIPSEGNILRASLDQFTPEQREHFRQAIREPSSDLKATDFQVAEALVHYTSYLTHQNSGELPAKFKKLERAAYIQRSQFSNPPTAFVKTEVLTQAPHLSHPPSMLQIGGSQMNHDFVFDFGYRFAIHGLLDPGAGFLKNSAIEAGNLKLSANQDSVWIEELTFLRVDNYQAYYEFDPKASWRVSTAIRENLLTENKTDHFFQLQGAYGVSTEVGGQLLYAVIANDVNLGHELVQKTWELGPELGTVVSYRSMKAYLNVGAGQSPSDRTGTSYFRWKSGLNWMLNKNFSLALEGQFIRLTEKDIEGSRYSAGVRYYF